LKKNIKKQKKQKTKEEDNLGKKKIKKNMQNLKKI